MQFGFIGVGKMGGGLARNLIRSGREVLLAARTKESAEKTAAAGPSGRAVEGMRELAGVDILFTCLPKPDDVKKVMLGADGLLGLMKPGAVHIETSTIDPATARLLCDKAAERKVDYLQCTLGKTPVDAEKGEAPLFVGGAVETYAKVRAILDIIGRPVHLGEVEASAAFKLISNLIGMTNLAVLAEGLRLGERAGMDKGLLIKLLTETGARSFQLDVRGPWLAQGDFAARFGLNLALKDMRLGCAMAEDWGVDALTMRAARDYFETASSAGWGEDDCNAVYKVVK